MKAAAVTYRFAGEVNRAKRQSIFPASLRANGSRVRAPDDRLREAIQKAAKQGWIASSLALLAMTAF
jgi:hypothetical protein